MHIKRRALYLTAESYVSHRPISKYQCTRLGFEPTRGACIDACLSGDVTRSFWLYDIKLFKFLLSTNSERYAQKFISRNNNAKRTNPKSAQ